MTDDTKPLALRLADALERPRTLVEADEIISELRRLAAVEDEYKALRADAERYRFLRAENAVDWSDLDPRHLRGLDWSAAKFGESVDAAIDAARAQEAK